MPEDAIGHRLVSIGGARINVLALSEVGHPYAAVEHLDMAFSASTRRLDDCNVSGYCAVAFYGHFSEPDCFKARHVILGVHGPWQGNRQPTCLDRLANVARAVSLARSMCVLVEVAYSARNVETRSSCCSRGLSGCRACADGVRPVDSNWPRRRMRRQRQRAPIESMPPEIEPDRPGDLRARHQSASSVAAWVDSLACVAAASDASRRLLR